MIIFAWCFVVFAFVLFFVSFFAPEMIVICALFGIVAFVLFQEVWSEKVDEYVYNCIDKDAKQIIENKFDKTTSISVDGKIFIVKNKNIKELKCEGVTK